MEDLQQYLDDLEEYFEDRADADYEDERYIPNEEMRLLSKVQKIKAILNIEP